MVTIYKTEQDDIMADYRDANKWTLVDDVLSFAVMGWAVIGGLYLAYRIFF